MTPRQWGASQSWRKVYKGMVMLGWVSFGRSEAEAVQTLIGALSESEARDELGLGAIRDGFADLLFPGTSTVQTRLRYFLYLPQIFRDLDLKRGDARAALRASEAALITRLQALPDADTHLLIGSEAGAALKRMPSAVYWGGLGVWGIRSEPRAGIGEVLARMARGEPCWEDTPMISETDARGFALTRDEADWLADRCGAVRGGTLLGFLMQQARDVAGIEALPELTRLDLRADQRRLLDHALAFSGVMHGAALLYNLMLAERFKPDDQGEWSQALKDWSREEHRAVSAQTLIAPLIEQGALVGFTPKAITLRFIDAWIAVMRDPSGAEARTLIARREVEMKGARARLRLDPRDYRWSGSSGAARMTFRWGRVHQYLNDMAEAA